MAMLNLRDLDQLQRWGGGVRARGKIEYIQAKNVYDPPRDICPYYHLVPKDLKGNIAFRRKLLSMGAESEQKAHELYLMCARDILFFINSFLFTFDPRLTQPVIPFITFPFQDEGLVKMQECLGKEDLGIEKSRDEGASWMGMCLIEHAWHFKGGQAFKLVSRTEDLVDKKADPDCLFWKIMFIIEKLPGWLQPNYEKTHLRLSNLDNSSVISGASTVKDVARGGRSTAIFLDEFAAVDVGYAMLAATADNTNCRIVNSTPQGTGNAHYDFMHNPTTKTLRFHWPQDPRKNPGLYIATEEKIELYDHHYKYPKEYDFIRDGRWRSPWYDAECLRRVTKAEISQELDIDYLGAGYQFFDMAVIENVRKKSIFPAYETGDFEISRDTPLGAKWKSHPKGYTKLWIHLGADNRPPEDRAYVIGMDVATGTGASNSVITVGDKKANEVVLSFASPIIKAHELGWLAMAIGYWFKGNQDAALLIPEAGGDGRIVLDVLRDHSYPNIYMMKQDKTLTGVTTDIPGWHETKERKKSILGELQRALGAGEFIEHENEVLTEMREYIRLSNGAVAHARSESTIDPTGAKANHGDRVMSRAVCWQGMREFQNDPEEEEPESPHGSFRWRMEESAREKAEEESEREW